MDALWLCLGLFAVGLLPIFPVFLSKLRKSENPRTRVFGRVLGVGLLWLCFTATASGLFLAFLHIFKADWQSALVPALLGFSALGAYLSYRVARR